MSKGRYKRQCKKRKKRIIPRRKRRNKAKQAKRNIKPVNSSPMNRHHLCYQKVSWNRGHAKAVRNFWYCNIPMNINYHRAIHQKIVSIPVPDEQLAKDVYYHLVMLAQHGEITENDTFEQRILLLASLFDDESPSTAHALRKQLDI